MWKSLQAHLDLDAPTSLDGGVYLGCGQYDIPNQPKLIQEKQEIMQPFLDKNDSRTADATKAASGDTSKLVKNSSTIKSWKYQMHGHAERCVSKYCELADVAEASLRKVATPNLDDHQLQPEDFETKGKLSNIASRIVLTALFFARMARPDCLWTVNVLAREVMRWNVGVR